MLNLCSFYVSIYSKMIFFDSTKVIYSILTCYTVNYMLILYLEYIIK